LDYLPNSLSSPFSPQPSLFSLFELLVSLKYIFQISKNLKEPTLSQILLKSASGRGGHREKDLTAVSSGGLKTGCNTSSSFCSVCSVCLVISDPVIALAAF